MTPAGLAVDGTPTFDQWRAAGAFLQQAAGRVNWWVGDLLVYGRDRFGEAYAQVLDEADYTDESLRVAEWVARRIPGVNRLTSLSFSHHLQVASLPADVAHPLLALAATEGWTTRDLRQAVRQHKAGVSVLPPADGEPCCTVADLNELVRRGERFGTIYADPPWQYGNQGTRAATDNHDPTMPTADIAAC